MKLFVTLRTQTAKDMIQPDIHVGIVHAIELHFTLKGEYTWNGLPVKGKQTATYSPDGTILWNGKSFKELLFASSNEEDYFLLEDVIIGINFHWERKETQAFRSSLKLTTENEKVVAINILPVEQYLVSVISSEMKATAGLQYLKAHAVISRSWVLAQMENRQHPDSITDDAAATPPVTNANGEIEINRWYGRSAHTLFDVCADDHCQRYQGITRASNPTVEQAVNGTYGEVLTYDGQICDARFSKSCGGISEAYEYCWGNEPHPYLKPVRCLDDTHTLPDLTQETEAEKWLRSSPDAFCNTHDKKLLSQILNEYDLETKNFYRWTVDLTQEKLQDLIQEKQHIEMGKIKSITPLQRGYSGRISKLRIEGEKATLVIGKELEIRRTLSDTHLLSSAFVIDKTKDGFRLTGAGWGHGVGFCQIGGAVMTEKGYSYDRILSHYFTNASLTKLYQ